MSDLENKPSTRNQSSLAARDFGSRISDEIGTDQSYGQGLVPVGLSNVVAIAAGGWHNLALKADGTLLGWGRNDYGQSDIPAGISNVLAVQAGAAHSMVLSPNGTVMAWGMNTYGQTNVPAGLSNVIAIAAGGWHNLALKSDGTVVAWGAGGPSTNTNVSYGQNIVPAGLSNVVQIAAGSVHSLALVGDGAPITKGLLTAANFASNTFSALLPTRNGNVYRLEYKETLATQSWNRSEEHTSELQSHS